jgi:hypothetical protein
VRTVYFILLNLVFRSSDATFLHCLALNNWMGLIVSISCSTKSLSMKHIHHPLLQTASADVTSLLDEVLSHV